MRDNRALSQLKCWLRAVQIPFQDGNGVDLVVTDAASNKINVCVVADGAAGAAEAVVVNGTTLTGRDLGDALDEFSSLQHSLGYEAVPPVDRGKIPRTKLSNGEDFVLSAIRHTEFRRVPNPSKEVFRRYKSLVTRSVHKFFRQNMQLCNDNMLGLEDLTTYALIWITTFAGLCEIPAEEERSDDQNQRLAYNFLGQRFHAFRTHLVCSGRNVFPTLDDAFIGQRGRPYDYANKGCWEGDEVLQEETESLIERRRREWRRNETFPIDNTADKTERRVNAVNVLDRLLGEKDHDDMVGILKSAIDNTRIEPDARAEAERRLRRHTAECDTCSGTSAKPQPVRRAFTGAALYATPPVKHLPEDPNLFADEEGNVFHTAGEAARFWGGIHKKHVRAILNGQMRDFRGHTFKFVSAMAA